MQILLLNLVMDGPPALSLSMDSHDVLNSPPRPKDSPIINQRVLARIGFSSSILLVGVLFVLFRELGDGSSSQRDQTMVRNFPSSDLADSRK